MMWGGWGAKQWSFEFGEGYTQERFTVTVYLPQAGQVWDYTKEADLKVQRRLTMRRALCFTQG
jgi:hypothetical protein